jgi:adenosine deaminase
VGKPPGFTRPKNVVKGNIMDNVRNELHKLKKADLHNHLSLGPSLSSLKKYYPNCNLVIPKQYNGLEGMIDFIHNNINNVMTTKTDVIKFMEIAIEDCIADNVVLLEASIDINLIRHFNESIEQLIEVVEYLKNRYKSKINFKPDIGFNKTDSIEKVYFNATKCIESGVYNGIDLYGRENNMKLDGFVDLFNLAKSKGLKTKVHIGEFSDPTSIENAIDLFRPMEIQHGIKAAYSEKTMSKILNEAIRLNICPQSNIALGSELSLSEHPIRTLYDHGINISINTDDRILFGASLTDQFEDLIRNHVFTINEIKDICEKSIK